MPKPRKNELIVCTYFTWLLGQRCGVYFADGRSHGHRRHSLGRRDRQEALGELKELDLRMAIRAGRVDPAVLDQGLPKELGLDDGWTDYLDHVGRPRVTGGAGPGTKKRYRPVGEKFIAFVRSQDIDTWNQVKRSTLEAYAAHLDGEGYAYATEYLELTTLKQAVKWFVAEGMLPGTCLIQLPMRKAEGTDTYCWTDGQVAAILEHCAKNQELQWLGNVVTALMCTGLRISELAGLRLTDISLESNMITLTDESTRAPKKLHGPARIMKNRRSRSFPIHPELRPVLLGISLSADGRVFHGPLGGKIKPDTVRRILVRDVLTVLADRFPVADGDIGFVDGRLHSFRHYFCSRCARDGVSEQVLMHWLGHANSRMVKHYFHLHDQDAQRQMERLKPISKPVRNRSAG